MIIMRPFFIGTCFLAMVPAIALADNRPAVSAKLRAAVSQYFEAQEGYRQGDLITREQVEPLLASLRKMGLAPPDAKQILGDVLPADSFLPQQLASRAGRAFMRRIAGYPDAYDRLDRLSELPRGRQTVRDLIRGRDGYKMLQYMTTTRGGKQLGKMLSKSPGAGDFNAPTGRIYTADGLLLRLEQSRKASSKPKRKEGA
jgi:hypothetical protein